MKTLVHKNLHNGLWALTQRGRVVGYCTACELIDWDSKEDAKKAAFSRSGNKRTVHLWARGTLVNVEGFAPLKERTVDIAHAITRRVDLEPIHYNPGRGESGFMMFGKHFPSGSVAVFNSHGMFAG